MDNFFLGTGLALIFLMILVLVRMLKGPTVIDRLVAVNVIGTKAAVLLVIMGIVFQRVEMFVDIALGYGLLNFITSIAAAKYYHHHGSHHPELQWEGEPKHLDRGENA
tara:strand:+ start:513 stop:836 length:324 start_codon:yes stop_codon:yes gene_type:complete